MKYAPVRRNRDEIRYLIIAELINTVPDSKKSDLHSSYNPNGISKRKTVNPKTYPTIYLPVSRILLEDVVVQTFWKNI
ncbi:MAG: hypothetical protein AB2L20_28780 [Mangrovibacterium sp.]